MCLIILITCALNGEPFASLELLKLTIASNLLVQASIWKVSIEIAIWNSVRRISVLEKSANNYVFCHLGQACYAVLQSWVSKKFMTGCVVLFPIAVTFFVTWWIVQFFDGFFSLIYERLGVEIFGLGFLTSLIFIFFVGIFASSWMGATVFWVGERFIKRMPFVKHIYSASKQISAIISPVSVQKKLCKKLLMLFLTAEISLFFIDELIGSKTQSTDTSYPPVGYDVSNLLLRQRID
nr:protein like COV 2-like [Tanacetum cinerariifolium]